MGRFISIEELPDSLREAIGDLTNNTPIAKRFDAALAAGDKKTMAVITILSSVFKLYEIQRFLEKENHPLSEAMEVLAKNISDGLGYAFTEDARLAVKEDSGIFAEVYSLYTESEEYVQKEGNRLIQEYSRSSFQPTSPKFND